MSYNECAFSPVPKQRAGRCSSVAEQRFRKPQVKGSNPLTGSTRPLFQQAPALAAKPPIRKLVITFGITGELP